METVDEKSVTWLESKKLLDKKSKEKELGYEQKNSLEHLSKFCKLSEKKTTELLKELEKIKRLKDRQKIIIVNFLPKNEEELKLLFAHEIISLSEDEKNKIINIVKKFT